VIRFAKFYYNMGHASGTQDKAQYADLKKNANTLPQVVAGL
jgi:hypothetical protein